jgi:hypothetical protein
MKEKSENSNMNEKNGYLQFINDMSQRRLDNDATSPLMGFSSDPAVESLTLSQCRRLRLISHITAHRSLSAPSVPLGDCVFFLSGIASSASPRNATDQSRPRTASFSRVAILVYLAPHQQAHSLNIMPRLRYLILALSVLLTEAVFGGSPMMFTMINQRNMKLQICKICRP